MRSCLCGFSYDSRSAEYLHKHIFVRLFDNKKQQQRRREVEKYFREKTHRVD